MKKHKQIEAHFDRHLYWEVREQLHDQIQVELYQQLYDLLWSPIWENTFRAIVGQLYHLIRWNTADEYFTE
jgi:hypothetical protein